MRNNSPGAASLICVLMILCVAGSARAQSGRRAKVRTQTSAPVQRTTEAEPEKPASETKPETRRVSLIVTIDEDQGAAGTFLGNSQLVVRGFAEQLKKNSALNYKVEKRMGRKEASDLAKSDRETYVVWLYLERLMIASSREDNDVYVNYVLFAPGTGKSKTEGRVLVRGSRQRVGIGNIPVGIPLPPTGTGNARMDDALLYAGREAAERVMPELDVIDAPEKQ